MKLTYFGFPKELWRTIRTSKGGNYVVCQYGTGKCKGGGKGKDPAARQLGIGDVLGGVPPMKQAEPPATVPPGGPRAPIAPSEKQP